MDTAILTPQNIFIKVVRYDIPVFQRPYIWTQEQQWEPLWEDVTDLAETIIEKGSAPSHFMGAVVLQQIPNPQHGGIETRVVVDGQQRLTTVQLLLDAIQEFCMHHGFEGAAERLGLLVQNPKAFLEGNADLSFKIWPTEFDHAAFRHVMQNDLDSDNYKNNRIVMAHDFFKSQVQQWLEQSPQSEQPGKAVEALEKAVRECLDFAVINLNSSDNPHIIFETLNARGTPLLPSDQVKNHILYQAGVGIGYEDEQPTTEAAELWNLNDGWWREEIGRGHQRRPRVDVLLNNWLAMRNGREVRAHNEFQAFERYVESMNGKQDIWAIAADLKRMSDIYQSVEECSYPGIETFLQRRRVMNAGAVMPALLWLLSSELPQAQLHKAITALDSYMVRRMACGLTARNYAQLFIDLVAELAKNDNETAGDIVADFLAKQEAIAYKWPTDGEFLDAFLQYPLYQWLTAGRLNLLLQGIEVGLRTPLAETYSVPGGLQIEHIMPQDWRQNWPLPTDSPDEERATTRRQRLIHTIGNLTLVTGRLNAKLSNARWEDKRLTLREHTVLMLNTTLLKDHWDQWNETTIEERSKKLHEAAIKIWPRPHADAIG